MAPIKEAAYATLLMNDEYLPGAMVLGHSLKDKGAKARLVVLATMDNLSASTITELRTIYDEIIPVNRIVNKHPANLYLMDRPDLISTFTKIELWRQTRFRQIVYMDADMVAIRAPNELLNYDAEFAAVPDVGWPDCFNSGLLVLRPNLGDYYSLLALAQRGISFDGADQGLLNMHFQDWQRLSFAYNCTPSGSYQYIPAYKHFQSSISLLHFIGRDKPWKMGRDYMHTSGVYGELLGRWWATYDKHYRVHTSYHSSQSEVSPRTVGGRVSDEKTTSQMEYAPSEVYFEHEKLPSLQPKPPSEAPLMLAEGAMGNQPESTDPINKPRFEPAPATEQRTFSAPRMEWDASRAPPPSDSRPEAHNLPSQIYEFNQDTSLFQTPQYPEAPTDMYYQVPSKAAKVEKPKPIFPWEEHAPRPTRVFPQEKPPSPEPEPELEPEQRHESEQELELEPELEQEKEPESALEVEVEPDTAARTFSDASESSEIMNVSPLSSSGVSESDPWNRFPRTNAWDAMPEIERYVQAIAQARKGKVQVIHPEGARSETGNDSSLSPLSGRERRPSMKITDFPTEIERPSLPVTPAPRHPSFWGEERDDAGQLPAAEGVPKQQDWVSRFSSYLQPRFVSRASAPPSPPQILFWRCQFCGKQNPVEKLEELQRLQSEVLQTGPKLVPKELSKREMPSSSTGDPVGVVANVTANAPTPKQLTATYGSMELPKSGVDIAAGAAPA